MIRKENIWKDKAVREGVIEEGNEGIKGIMVGERGDWGLFWE